MITHANFAVEPWSLRETALDLELLAQAESVFALSNGHIGLRANLDEGEPFGLPGTYLNSFYELRPLPHAEAAYGLPESGQTIVNVTNGKIMRLLVDDEPLDVRYGQLLTHERELDLRAGLLRRHVDWRSPAGTAVRICSTRLVSFVQRAVAAILYEVEPLEAAVRIVLQSELVANEPAPARSGDPRAAAALESPLVSEEFFDHALRVVLVHSTRNSKLGMAAGMDHLVDGPPGTDTTAESRGDLGRVTVASDLEPGQRLKAVKFLAYAWSSQRSHPALRDEVVAALAEGRHTGWDGLVAGQRAYLDEFWDRADVELDGTSSFNRPCASRSFTRCRRAPVRRGARSRRRA
jgi:alpha,alpha-trehalose phosphorylase